MLKNSNQSFGSIAKLFHWIIGPTILIMLVLGYLMSGPILLNLHKLIGLTILILVTLRLIWTTTNIHPAFPDKMPLFEKILSKAVHLLLYVCMFGMPLSGWAMATSFGFAPHIGNMKFLMPGIEINKSFGELLKDIHGTIAYILIVCICLHAVGALKHHFINKDNVLKRMLPFIKS